MKIGIYSRISRESSDNMNQLLILRDYCQKMDYDIYDEYVDIVSGGSPNRPEFNRMMADASKRKFDMLLFVIGKQKCSENGNCNAVKTGTGIQ